jgi:hypothetical protein
LLITGALVGLHIFGLWVELHKWALKTLNLEFHTTTTTRHRQPRPSSKGKQGLLGIGTSVGWVQFDFARITARSRPGLQSRIDSTSAVDKRWWML